MDVRVGLWRKLSAEELMLLNCGVGEDSWESLGLQEVQPVHSEGDQSWVFIGRTDVEAVTPILWPPHVKSWLIGKDLDAGRDWGQKKGMTEDEMAGWHHRLDRHEFAWTPGVGDGQGGLTCCNSRGRKESDTTEWLNWTELSRITKLCSSLYGVEIKEITSYIIPPFCRQVYLVEWKDCWIFGRESYFDCLLSYFGNKKKLISFCFLMLPNKLLYRPLRYKNQEHYRIIYF